MKESVKTVIFVIYVSLVTKPIDLRFITSTNLIPENSTLHEEEGSIYSKAH